MEYSTCIISVPKYLVQIKYCKIQVPEDNNNFKVKKYY